MKISINMLKITSWVFSVFLSMYFEMVFTKADSAIITRIGKHRIPFPAPGFSPAQHYNLFMPDFYLSEAPARRISAAP